MSSLLVTIVVESDDRTTWSGETRSLKTNSGWGKGQRPGLPQPRATPWAGRARRALPILGLGPLPRRAEHDLHAAVLGAAGVGGVGGDGVLLAVREDADAAFGE